MGRRVGADLALSLLVLSVWLRILTPSNEADPPTGFSWISLYLLFNFYAAIMSYLGASPGKYMLGLRVVDRRSGGRLSVGLAAVRVWFGSAAYSVLHGRCSTSAAAHCRIGRPIRS